MRFKAASLAIALALAAPVAWSAAPAVALTDTAVQAPESAAGPPLVPARTRSWKPSSRASLIA